MATIRTYTDLEQSKRLAKILPIESADMRYGYIAPYEFSDRMYEGGYDNVPYPKDFLEKNPNFSENDYDDSLPCWSLAALSEFILPYIADDNGDIYKFYLSKDDLDIWFAYYKSDDFSIHISKESDNMIDVILEMICWLKKEEYI